MRLNVKYNLTTTTTIQHHHDALSSDRSFVSVFLLCRIHTSITDACIGSLGKRQ
jgi:hypothetical protein